MTIIKEQTETHCVVRTDTYARTLDHIRRLFEIAQGDFPELKPEDVEVVQYAGQNFARTYGLEFEKPQGATVPDDYRMTHELEMTF